MKAIARLFILLTLFITGTAHASDERWHDFLKRHSQQLAQFEDGTHRQVRIAAMLSRRLQRIMQTGNINIRDQYGQTALMLASALENKEIIHGLLLHGADAGIATLKGRSAHDLCTDPDIKRELISCSLNQIPGGSLHEAVAQDDQTQALRLLRSGADVNESDPEGRTPLMLLEANQQNMAELLLLAGANPAHWCMNARRRAKVNRVEVLFTHRGLNAEELEAEDAEFARQLDNLRQERINWRKFRDAALVRPRLRGCPSSFQWNRREKRHLSNNLVYKMNEEQNGPGHSGYLGHIYHGFVTLHYDQPDVPPLRFPIQSGGRSYQYRGSGADTVPVIPEGMQARIYPDLHGYSINGFYISCMGRKAIPKFCEDRTEIMLHLALVAVPGETEAETKRCSGSHGCISLKSLSDWQTIYHELRRKGHPPMEGIEVSITYAVK